MERTAIGVMTALIREEVFGIAPPESLTLTPEGAEALYPIAKAQDLAHLLTGPLDRRGVLRGETGEAYRRAQLLAVYRTAGLDAELATLSSALSEAEIPHMPLKGSVLRHAYPKGWMRTSCDIDLLVREEDLERAAEVAREKLHYRQEAKSSHDVGFRTPGDIHIELHYTLIEEGQTSSSEKAILTKVWETAIPTGEGTRYRMPDPVFYFYHLAHMAKHALNGGCGIRPFLDLCILDTVPGADPAGREALIAEGGLATFRTAAEDLATLWFRDGTVSSPEITRDFADYILNAGIYGSTENRIAVARVKKGGKLRYALSRIFLPYRILKFHYPFLDGRPWLLPFYEVRRWCKLLFCGGVRRSVRELKINNSVSMERQQRTEKLLSEIGLKQETT